LYLKIIWQYKKLKNSFIGKSRYVRGFGLIIIKKLFELAKPKIILETNLGLIIPIGFSSDLKGPKM